MAKEQIVDIQTGKVTVQESDVKEVALTVDESIVQLRNIRNGILGQSDWMTFADSPTMSDEWKNYRQELRDITKTYKTLDDVKWPIKPS